MSDQFCVGGLYSNKHCKVLVSYSAEERNCMYPVHLMAHSALYATVTNIGKKVRR